MNNKLVQYSDPRAFNTCQERTTDIYIRINLPIQRSVELTWKTRKFFALTLMPNFSNSFKQMVELTKSLSILCSVDKNRKLQLNTVRIPILDIQIKEPFEQQTTDCLLFRCQIIVQCMGIVENVVRYSIVLVIQYHLCYIY